MVKTCTCTTPQLYQDGKIERCWNCWVPIKPKEVAPPPLPKPTPAHIQVTIEWVRHSAKQGMAIDRIARDFGITEFLVQAILRKEKV